MSTQTEHRPATAEQPATTDEGTSTHGWLLALLVLVAALLAFGVMYGITQLAGGDGYLLH